MYKIIDVLIQDCWGISGGFLQGKAMETSLKHRKFSVIHLGDDFCFATPLYMEH